MLTTDQILARAERCGRMTMRITGDATQGEVADVTILATGVHEVYARPCPRAGWQLVRQGAPMKVAS